MNAQLNCYKSGLSQEGFSSKGLLKLINHSIFNLAFLTYHADSNKGADVKLF